VEPARPSRATSSRLEQARRTAELLVFPGLGAASSIAVAKGHATKETVAAVWVAYQMLRSNQRSTP
jgi:hypothetical protein